MGRLTNPAGGYTSPQKIKLKEYEDLGLEPSEVAAALEELRVTRKFIHDQGLTFALASKLKQERKCNNE